MASVAEQFTLEVPTGTSEPVGGVQTTDTGVAPPVTVGAGYVSVAVKPMA
jgi:hypothetical protein